MITLKDLAKNALQVQDACNLSGVVHSFSRDVSTLRELLPDAGTDAINKHPVCVLYITQLAHLSGCGMVDQDVYFNANHACEKLVKS